MNNIPSDIWEIILKYIYNKKDLDKLLYSNKEISHLIHNRIYQLPQIAVSIGDSIYIYNDKEIVVKQKFGNNYISFIPESNNLLIYNNIGEIFLYDFMENRNIKIGNTLPANGMKMSPCGKYFCVFSSNFIKIKKLENNKIISVKTIEIKYHIMYRQFEVEFHNTKPLILISSSWLMDTGYLSTIFTPIHLYDFENDILTEFSNPDIKMPVHFNKNGSKIIFMKNHCQFSKKNIFGTIKTYSKEFSKDIEIFLNYNNKFIFDFIPNGPNWLISFGSFNDFFIYYINIYNSKIKHIIPSKSRFTKMKLYQNILTYINNNQVFILDLKNFKTKHITNKTNIFDITLPH